MVEKMKFLSIVGPKDDLDRVIDTYLTKYEMQLENSVVELKNAKNINPYMESNPCREELARVKEYVSQLTEKAETSKTMNVVQATEFLRELDEAVAKNKEQQATLLDEKKRIEEALQELKPYCDMHYNIQSILDFQFVKYRFGKVAIQYYAKLEEYAREDKNSIFYKCQSDSEYVWGIYFVPANMTQKVDTVYTSLHFERFHFHDGYEGTPMEALEAQQKKLEAMTKKLQEAEEEGRKLVQSRAGKLLAAQNCFVTMQEHYEIRKLVAFTKTEKAEFFVLCGWMTAKDTARFQKELESEVEIICMVEERSEKSKPPTKLKNPKLFKPYQMYIEMYGLPSYGEIDPTIFVAITYSVIFGIMFGDVGQGICLFLGGLLLYKLKRMNLAAIVSCAGVFSTIFGFMFGSVFGFENIIEPVWIRPVTKMSNLPFIGNLNSVFVYAIALGMGLVLITMILNIINRFRAHKMGEALFDTNGIAGFIFYLSLVVTIVLFMSGHKLPGTIILIVMFGLPLLLIALKEPLTSFMEKKSELIEGTIIMYIVQTFFELFEVLLSYFSNTLSFVRIGAFAVSHAAMMEVVLMLAGAENGATPNWLVVVLGNLFVMGMEGLIVGIQVLRLEYYEFFSRFYTGGGRPFKPYRNVTK